MPAPIRAARSLAEGTFAYRQSRESLFVMQAKVLAITRTTTSMMNRCSTITPPTSP
ncbi:MAG: hypothetical protein ACLSHU_09005 [Oscillospiraceae bacterium]